MADIYTFGVGIHLDDNVDPDLTCVKVIVHDRTRFKVIFVDNNTEARIIREYVIPHLLRYGVQYRNIATNPSISIRTFEDIHPETGEPLISIGVSVHAKNTKDSQVSNGEVLTFGMTGPRYNLSDGETATDDEPATETITIPFAEEPIWLFQDFMFRRLYPITQNFLQGLNAERVALLTKVDQLAGGVGDDEDHRRYDHAANLGRGLIGYTWEQINILTDDTIPTSKKKTRAQIVELLDKLEATFPDRLAIDKFFVRHDEVHWQDVRQNRQIRLVGDNYRPGEILKNINTEHLKTKNGVTAVDQVSAENEYARCVKQCFRAAWSDRRDLPRHTVQYSLGAGESVGTVPKSQLTDESTLGELPPQY